MTDRHAELDEALDRVITAAHEHLAAVKAADGRIDDDSVWQAYVTLNNASHEYDELLLDAFGEVTPWDVEAIDPAEEAGADELSEVEAIDPYEYVVSVRQRRDYRVPSVSALLELASTTRRAGLAEAGVAEEPVEAEPVESVGEAILELLQSGDGSLGALDVPQLEPLDGLVAVAEVNEPLDLEGFSEDDGVGPFRLSAEDRVVGRLDEHPYLDLDADDLDADDLDADDLDEDDLDADDLDEDGEDEDAAGGAGQLATAPEPDGRRSGDGADIR
jgi:hypothetical protein